MGVGGNAVDTLLVKGDADDLACGRKRGQVAVVAAAAVAQACAGAVEGHERTGAIFAVPLIYLTALFSLPCTPLLNIEKLINTFNFFILSILPQALHQFNVFIEIVL